MQIENFSEQPNHQLRLATPGGLQSPDRIRLAGAPSTDMMLLPATSAAACKPAAWTLAGPTQEALRTQALFNRAMSSKRVMPKLTQQLDTLCQEIETYEAWLRQFPADERPVASLVADALDRYDLPRIQQGLRNLHEKVQKAVHAGNSVTYSYIHRAKSGALISYHYRGANMVPERDFALPPFSPRTNASQKRTLVFLDDYVASGFQFLQVMTGLKNKSELPFDQIIYGTLVANPAAFKHIKAAGERDFETLYAGWMANIGMPDLARANSENMCAAGIGEVTLVCDQKETSLVDHICDTHGPSVAKAAEAFLNRYKHPSLGFGNLGRTVFAHNCPNTVPHMFWDTGVRDGVRQTAWFPLLDRVHDRSMYAFTKDMSDDDVIFRAG